MNVRMGATGTTFRAVLQGAIAGNKYFSIGSFEKLEDAALAVDEKIMELSICPIPMSKLNFPEKAKHHPNVYPDHRLPPNWHKMNRYRPPQPRKKGPYKIKKKQQKKSKEVDIRNLNTKPIPDMKSKAKRLKRKRARPPQFIELDLEEEEESSDGIEIEGTKTIRVSRVEGGFMDLQGESNDSEDGWIELESDDSDDFSDVVVCEQPPKKKPKLQTDTSPDAIT